MVVCGHHMGARADRFNSNQIQNMPEPKIFVKTSDNEALAVDRIIRWSWADKTLTLYYDGGRIEVSNQAYVGQLHKILLAKTDTLVSRKKQKVPLSQV